MSLQNYICQTPIVLIVFNRPIETQVIIDSIRLVRPPKVIVISDGPRIDFPSDVLNVQMTRDAIELIDWECEVIKIYRNKNLGCMLNVSLGLNKVFELTENAIILEDDCKPTLEFFKFMEWGLKRYEENKQVGMISGSNLIADKHKINYRNGFSIFINIWGWATWKDRWDKHNPFLSIREINQECDLLLIEKKFNYWQRCYWKELLKFTVYRSTTWDFQLQYSFFKNNLFSVYPHYNLIENIGFNGDGTHTNFSCPSYVSNNCPKDENKVMNIPENIIVDNSIERDFLLARVIWSFNPFSALKLKLKNLLMSIGIINQ